MDELIRLIGVQRERIETHGPALSQSEALTRSALIDPLLRGLGWNTEDPSHVVPEFPIPSRQISADYALFTGTENPDVIIEAKKLGELPGDTAHQAVTYCAADGFDCFAVTNGQRWEVYETRRPGALEQKRIAGFDIGRDTTSAVCSAALSLWRQRFVDGRPTHVELETVRTRTDPEPEVRPVTRNDNALSHWIRLSELDPPPYSTPRKLSLPKGPTVGARRWSELVPRLVEWLSSQGYLPDETLPIRRGDTLLVEERGRDGKHLSAAKKAGELWVDTDFSGKDHAENMRTIIQCAGLGDHEFSVLLHLKESE